MENNKMAVTCAICGKEEYVWKSRAKKYKTCSYKCQGKYNSKILSKKMKVNCKQCNKELILKPKRIKRVINNFCSVTCSNEFKKISYIGEKNPNCIYKYDRHFFDIIDTEDKAYLLGWIASDGHIKNGVCSIAIHKKDVEILQKIKSIFKNTSDIKYKKNDKLVYITFCSKQISKKMCEYLKISFGKKSNIVQFPDLNNDILKWGFLRGYFDGDGSVSNPKNSKTFYPICSIASDSVLMLQQIKDFCKIPCCISKNQISWSGVNALDFLGKLYDNNNFDGQYFALERKKRLFFEWASWIPAIGGNNSKKVLPKLTCNRLDKRAVMPYKKRTSDSGYDLTLIEKIKQVDDIEFYTTGIRIRPDFGWYFDLVARSSIVDTGYCIANDIGIIDRSYTGPIIVALRKINKNKEDLVLPSKIVQIIPRPIIHCEIEVVENFEETDRNSGGFGSTNLK